MLLEFVKNLLRLKAREDCLNQHRRPDAPARNLQLILREVEDVIPQPRLEMALHFGQVKIRPAAAFQQLARVMKEEQSKIKQPARHRPPIHPKMFFTQM